MDSAGSNSLRRRVCPAPRRSSSSSIPVPAQRARGSKPKQREGVKSHLWDSSFKQANKQTNINDKRSQRCQIADVRTGLFHQTMSIAAELLQAGVFSNKFFFSEYLSQLKTTFMKGKRKLICFQWSLLFTHLCDEHFTVFNSAYLM